MANFATKKYTRPVLAQNVKSLSATSFASVSTFANALSPRAGRKSAQFNALKSIVGRGFTSLLNDSNLSNSEKKVVVLIALNHVTKR